MPRQNGIALEIYTKKYDIGVANMAEENLLEKREMKRYQNHEVWRGCVIERAYIKTFLFLDFFQTKDVLPQWKIA